MGHGKKNVLYIVINIEGCSSINQVLNLLFKNYLFKFYKIQD